MPEFTHHRSIHGEAGRPPPTAKPGIPWLCDSCGQHLAMVTGRSFGTPSGVRGQLPATIRCPRCRRGSKKE